MEASPSVPPRAEEVPLASTLLNNESHDIDDVEAVAVAPGREVHQATDAEEEEDWEFTRGVPLRQSKLPWQPPTFTPRTHTPPAYRQTTIPTGPRTPQVAPRVDLRPVPVRKVVRRLPLPRADESQRQQEYDGRSVKKPRRAEKNPDRLMDERKSRLARHGQVRIPVLSELKTRGTCWDVDDMVLFPVRYPRDMPVDARNRKLAAIRYETAVPDGAMLFWAAMRHRKTERPIADPAEVYVARRLDQGARQVRQYAKFILWRTEFADGIQRVFLVHLAHFEVLDFTHPANQGLVQQALQRVAEEKKTTTTTQSAASTPPSKEAGAGRTSSAEASAAPSPGPRGPSPDPPEWNARLHQALNDALLM